MQRIIVVGGGISGLAAAHRAVEIAGKKKLPVEILLLEAGQRLGGVIATQEVKEFLCEGGPDGFITEKPWALELCERLNLNTQLIGAGAAHRTVYVVHRGILQPLPEGFFLLAPTRWLPVLRSPIFSWRAKLRLVCEVVMPRRRDTEDESLGSFVRRRLGKEVLDRVAQPLVGGIYGADPEHLSLAATLPRFLELERENRSIILAMWREQRRRTAGGKPGSGARYGLFVTFREGMGTIINALAARLPENSVVLGKKVVAVNRDPTGKAWVVRTQDNRDILAAGVVLATPAYTSAELVAGVAPRISEKLRTIPYTSAVTVNLGYQREQIPHPLDAFGFVVPAIESRSIIACTFSSVKYRGRAPNGHVLLRAFVGGAVQPFAVERNDNEIESAVQGELGDLLRIKSPPLFSRIQRHPRSLPTYRVGHLDLIHSLESCLRDLPGLAFAGSAYHGVGIPDCVHSGEEATQRLFEQLSVGSAGSMFRVI
jgi:oxygen-dependent protoporphyrinogen oxidase